ncbi:hypothetical protein KC951_02330 [Candidatus Saccharibacteria bacterium]|nr:hypothetical protein [Candidatus Saccharibacteria bacterium]
MIKKLLIGLGIFTLIIVVMSSSLVYAVAPKEQGVKVAPLRTLVAHEPGNTSSAKLKLTNETDKRLTIELTAENFNVIGEQYDYSFSVNDSAQWVRFVDPKIILEPGEKKEVSYSLAVPPDATPGGYYIALIATNLEPENTNDINEVTRVASLVYLEVVGDIARKGQLLTIDMPWFTSTNIIDTSVRVANQGNIHLDTRIGVEYYPWPLSNKSQSQQLRALTLPHTTRQITGQLDLGTMPGVYRVTYSYAPPQGGLEQQTHTVVYCPPWAMLLVITLLGIIVYTVYRLAHKLLRNTKNKRNLKAKAQQ